MYKIGQFSVLAKTTIKTLRYYEKEKLLVPTFVDDNGYRYYETHQLLDLAKIVSLRQVGLSIDEIKGVFDGIDLKSVLTNRKMQVEKDLIEYENQLSKIKYLIKEENMNYEATIKELPDYTIYYKEGVIKDFNGITEFILKSGEECKNANPNIECIKPDYCYVNYLDGEYRDKDIKIRYAKAVKEAGNETDTIKFEKLKPLTAVCIYHKGAYQNLGKAYGFIMKYIEDNNYEMLEFPRERYIDGMWNKDNEEDWLTEIQVPVKKK